MADQDARQQRRDKQRDLRRQQQKAVRKDKQRSDPFKPRVRVRVK